MAENDQEKTEDPTPRRREEAREEGNVAQSQDLTAACALLAGVFLLSWLSTQVLGGLKETMEVMLTSAHASNPTQSTDLAALLNFAGRTLASTVLPLMLAIAAVGLAASVGQVGFLVTGKPLMPRFSKLSPLKGAQNLFNARGGVRLLMSLGKLGIILGLAGWVIAADLPRILLLGHLSVAQAFAGSCQLVYDLAWKLAALLLVLAILDYAFQKWQHERDLRMSQQEVKEEMKRMEGDPMVKQRRSRVARQLAEQRNAQQVPQADVVVTNPTHYAVALKYDRTEMRAPQVVGKGADYLAMRIRQIAAGHDIPLVERKPLARALYHGVEVGEEIPPEHYTAVAEILAYVYGIGRQRQSA